MMKTSSPVAVENDKQGDVTKDQHQEDHVPVDLQAAPVVGQDALWCAQQYQG